MRIVRSILNVPLSSSLQACPISASTTMEKAGRAMGRCPECPTQFLLLLEPLKSPGESTQLPSEVFAALHVNTYLVHRITNVELHVVPITMTGGTDVLSGQPTIAQNPSVSGIFHPEDLNVLQSLNDVIGIRPAFDGTLHPIASRLIIMYGCLVKFKVEAGDQQCPCNFESCHGCCWVGSDCFPQLFHACDIVDNGTLWQRYVKSKIVRAALLVQRIHEFFPYAFAIEHGFQCG
jgi:hypothetical protein